MWIVHSASFFLFCFLGTAVSAHVWGWGGCGCVVLLKEVSWKDALSANRKAKLAYRGILNGGASA